jgi:transposase-like protein
VRRVCDKMSCPYCKSERIIKGTDRFKCLDCHKSFKYLKLDDIKETIRRAEAIVKSAQDVRSVTQIIRRLV